MSHQIDWTKEALSGKRVTLNEIKDDLEKFYGYEQMTPWQTTICDSYDDFIFEIRQRDPASNCTKMIKDHIIINSARSVHNKVRREDWQKLKGEQSRTNLIREISTQIEIHSNESDKNPLILEEMRMGLGCDDWLRFYDHYIHEGVYEDERYEHYKRFLLKGIWAIVFFVDHTIVCRLPKEIKLDSSGKLHAIDEPAIEWQDGSKDFYRHGVYIGNLYENSKLTTQSFSEILQIRNIEQRYAIMRDLSWEDIKRNTDIKEIKRPSRKGNKLYEMTIGRGTAKVVKYKDPSTDRIYWSFVPETIETADEGMAWKFQLSLEEYRRINAEA